MSGTQASFHVANGQIIGPNGQPFIAKGINVRWDQLNSVVGNGTNMPLTNYFPGINMVRVNGARAVLMSVLKSGNTSTIAIVDGVKAGELVATEGALFLSNALATGSQ